MRKTFEQRINDGDIPFRKVMLDKERTMIWDMKCAKMFEEVLPESKFHRAVNDPTAAEQSAIMWASLAREDSTLTIEDVDELVHAGVWGAVWLAWSELFNEGTPKAKK